MFGYVPLYRTPEGAYEQVDRRLGDLTEAVTRVEVKLDSLRNDMDTKFDAVRSDMDVKTEAIRNDMDAKFDAVRSEMSAKFNTLIIVMATGAVGITGALITIAFRI